MEAPLSIQSQTSEVAARFSQELAHVKTEPTPAAVEQLRLAFLGRKGHVTGLLEGLRHCSKEERPQAGKAINQLKQTVEQAISDLKDAAQNWAILENLKKPKLDHTLPVRSQLSSGSLHPVSLIRKELLEQFHRLGFTVYDGPEIDFEFYNFSALNIPEHHPARDMQDTFYLDRGNDELAHDPMVLRTHTSNIQIHCMLQERPPLRIVAPGRVFRCDSDATHTPMFHQIEAFVVDKHINFAHMKGVIDTFLKAIFGNDLKTRLRPSFFPFVEPGAEVDMQCVQCRGQGCRLCKNTGWIEVGGCGMIHPNVFESVEYDSDYYSGFAFGFGIDRLAMLKFGLTDLRQLFDGDVQFLNQFPNA